MAIEDILRKLEETPVPPVRKAALAYSGGLDSSLSVELLRRVYKAEAIVAITCDVGQGAEEIREGRRKARLLKSSGSGRPSGRTPITTATRSRRR